jgi:hypothetical protein
MYCDTVWVPHPRDVFVFVAILEIGVDRRHNAKRLFPQEKDTLHILQKVYMYS